MDSLLAKLRALASSDTLPMHMPGHKRNAAAFPWLADLGCRMDITEIDGFDNLHDPRDLFVDMERRAARLWGARESICLVNGSTAGVLAAVRAVLAQGGAMLMARGSHRSVYHAAEIVGADTYYLFPPQDPSLGIWGPVSAQDVAAGLDAHPDVKLVVVTSPTYEGVLSPIAAIAAVCHDRKIPLLVDEAHGAHLGFGAFPAGAVAAGADLVVQSLHKTLPSLTQTAVLHVSGSLVEPADVRRNASMFQTSSPSYLLSASIDGCLRCLEAEGGALADRWLAALDGFYAAADKLQNLRVCRCSAAARDPSKIVISTCRCDLDGHALMTLLRERFQIELEMAGAFYGLAMTGMGDTAESLNRLASALLTIDRELHPEEPRHGRPFHPPERVMSVREALASRGAFRPRADAAGLICGEYIGAYPPGTPLVVPGERLDEETLAAVASMVDIRSTGGCVPDSVFCIDQSGRMV